MSKEMTKAQVEKMANKLEGMADLKQVDALAHELHELKPSDRKAIMNKIQSDEAHHKADLPAIDFYSSGDLKAMDVQKNGKTTDHIEFDQSSGKRTLLDSHNDVADSHNVYDTVSGQLTAEKINYKDGTVITATHSRDTGKLLIEDTLYPHGKQKRHLEFDKDGNQAVAEYTHYDGSNTHYEYQKQKKVDQIDTDVKGNKVETIWNPDTQKVVVIDTTNVDKSGSFSKFDPKDGHLISINVKDKDGQITQWHE